MLVFLKLVYECVSPNLFAKCLQMVGWQKPQNGWQLTWTNFNGSREELLNAALSLLTCIFKFSIFHAQISHHRLCIKSATIRIFWMHLTGFYEAYIPTNFCCKNAPKCNSHTLIDKKYYFGAKIQTILKISLTSIFGTKFVNFTWNSSKCNS